MVYVMTDLELDDEDQRDLAYPCVETSKPMQPQYPWGLRITLTEKELDKLNLDPTEAVIGGMIHLHAMAKITSVSEDQREGGEKSCRVEMQIQQMCVESEDEENAEADADEDVKPRRLKYRT